MAESKEDEIIRKYINCGAYYRCSLCGHDIQSFNDSDFDLAFTRGKLIGHYNDKHKQYDQSEANKVKELLNEANQTGYAMPPHSMDFPTFDEFFDKLILECRGMRDTKGKEYAHSTSRFTNFDRASERLGISRLMVANVYLHKHLDAIDSYILHKETYSGENIRGRIVDAITYLCLIAGMIEAESQ